MKKIGIIVVSITVFSVMSFGSFVYAHGGETHATEAESTSHTELTDTQMRTIIALLQKLIFLLTIKRDAHTSVHQTTAPDSEIVSDHVEDTHAEDGEMEVHHDEHAEESETIEVESAPKLVIEIESHYDKTHVHVRYTDKPEAMFFVDASLDDEIGLIADIHEQTGLPEDEIREAIVRVGE